MSIIMTVYLDFINCFCYHSFALHSGILLFWCLFTALNAEKGQKTTDVKALPIGRRFN